MLINNDGLESIRQARQHYDELVVPTEQQSSGREKEYITLSRIPVDRLYTPLDVKETNYLSNIGFPGQFPLTHG